MTIESPLEVHAELDPATREVVAAMKRWWDLAELIAELDAFVLLGTLDLAAAPAGRGVAGGVRRAPRR